MEHSGKNVLAVSKKMEVSHVALGNWKHNKVDCSKITAENLMRFCDETGTQWRWVLTGEGLAVAPPAISETPIMRRMHLALAVMEEQAPYNLERVVQMVEATAQITQPPKP